MKRSKNLLLLVLFIVGAVFSADLIKIDTNDFSQVKEAIKNVNLRVNYFDDNLVIATTENGFLKPNNYTLIEENAWSKENNDYFLIFLNKNDRSNYVEDIKKISNVLVNEKNYLIISILSANVKQLKPAVHGGIVKISNTKAKLPQKNFPDFKAKKNSSNRNSFITDLLASIDIELVEENIQIMEDYGTRNCYEPESVEAQNWIKGVFEGYGLTVELMDFTMSGGASSDNVIATKLGATNPDEFVIIGGHYDSITSGGGDAPGSDDNASGTAGVMEIARILNDYEFDKTLIFCAWSGEEYGLYGSEAYATMAEQSEMNILGYFNLDMIGYLHPGNEFLTHIMAPESAEPLVQFYKNVTSTYVPELATYDGTLIGGNSDHSSFNAHGFMGIFPFEDGSNYSPYIHSADDLIGPSLNSMEQVELFIKASLASAAILASNRPEGLVGLPNDGYIDLNWSEFDGAESYNIYKDEVETPYANISDGTTYQDNNVINGTEYSYYMTAVLADASETLPSNTISVTPNIPLALPFNDDFESQSFHPYWNFGGNADWTIDTSVSHLGNNSARSGSIGHNQNSEMVIEATINGPGNINFYKKVSSENNYDYLSFFINGILIDEWAGEDDWSEESHDLAVGFYEFKWIYDKDVGVQSGSDCGWIDDIVITQDVSIFDDNNNLNYSKLSNNYPNPFNPVTRINYELRITNYELAEIVVYNSVGQEVWSSPITHHALRVTDFILFDGSKFNSGIYYYSLIVDGKKMDTKSMVLIK